MARLNAANNAQSTLNGGITDVATSLVVTSATGFPSTPFMISVEEELMEVTNVATNTFTVTRGMESTTNVAHDNLTIVENLWTAGTYHAIWSLSDNEYIYFGDSNDLNMGFDPALGGVFKITGGALKIDCTAGISIESGGYLQLRGDNIQLESEDSSHLYLDATTGGAINLYYDHAKKFETTSTGVKITDLLETLDIEIREAGELWFLDSTLDDYYIRNDGVNGLEFGWGLFRSAYFNIGGSCELFYNGDSKFETTNTGIEVTGNCVVTGNIDADNMSASEATELTDGSETTLHTHASSGGLNAITAQIIFG